MKNNQRLTTIILIMLYMIIVFSCILIAFGKQFIRIHIVLLLLGLSQVISGINQINISKELTEEGIISNNTHINGIFSVIIGLVIIIVWIFRRVI